MSAHDLSVTRGRQRRARNRSWRPGSDRSSSHAGRLVAGSCLAVAIWIPTIAPARVWTSDTASVTAMECALEFIVTVQRVPAVLWVSQDVTCLSC